MRAGIYMLTSPTGKSYIGQSVCLKRRLSHYKCYDCSEQPYIYNALMKYGFDNFKITILYEKDRDKLKDNELNEKEMYYIKKYNTLSPNGYNLTIGGDGLSRPTKETREKISGGNKGKHQTEKTKKQISLKLKERFAKGEIEVANKRKIVCLLNDEFYKSYNSISEAAKELNIAASSIRNILKNRSIKTRQGYKFCYLEDYK